MIQFKIEEDGKLTDWSGCFHSSKEADDWYKIHGLYFESRGYKLIRIENKRKRFNDFGCSGKQK